MCFCRNVFVCIHMCVSLSRVELTTQFLCKIFIEKIDEHLCTLLSSLFSLSGLSTLNLSLNISLIPFSTRALSLSPSLFITSLIISTFSSSPSLSVRPRRVTLPEEQHFTLFTITGRHKKRRLFLRLLLFLPLLMNNI